MLLILTCFNLAGGYAIAAAIVSGSPASAAEHHLPHHPFQHSIKKNDFGVKIQQVNKTESEEEENLKDLAQLADISLGDLFRFHPDFRQLNKHFLVHYAAAIKIKALAAFILYHNFRL